jgi:hypothetical protein
MCWCYRHGLETCFCGLHFRVAVLLPICFSYSGTAIGLWDRYDVCTSSVPTYRRSRNFIWTRWYWEESNHRTFYFPTLKTNNMAHARTCDVGRSLTSDSWNLYMFQRCLVRQWPRGLRHELPSPSQTLRSWVRGMDVCLGLFCVYMSSVVSSLAAGWSPA